MILTDQFNFTLPSELIAQNPIFPRDQCRLMVINRKYQTIDHCIFSNIGEYLQAGDLLVLNDTRVLPARFYAIKKESGGKVEILFLHHHKDWWASSLNPSRRVRIGTILVLPENPSISWLVVGRDSDWWYLKPSFSQDEENKIFLKYGHTPTPPYIKTPQLKLDDYQTVYARHDGSVAAPTAGIHFTEPLIIHLQKQEVRFAFLTLHVGPGTFFPVKTHTIEEHRMHSECFELNRTTAEAILNTKKRGNRVIAVGTTVVRVLESIHQRHKYICEDHGETDIFIYPGFQFQMVDAMITNFHLPRSTLFMLVCAFAGTDFMKQVYAEAINHRYRFYSFGDATFII